MWRCLDGLPYVLGHLLLHLRLRSCQLLLSEWLRLGPFVVGGVVLLVGLVRAAATLRLAALWVVQALFERLRARRVLDALLADGLECDGVLLVLEGREEVLGRLAIFVDRVVVVASCGGSRDIRMREQRQHNQKSGNGEREAVSAANTRTHRCQLARPGWQFRCPCRAARWTSCTVRGSPIGSTQSTGMRLGDELLCMRRLFSASSIADCSLRCSTCVTA